MATQERSLWAWPRTRANRLAVGGGGSEESSIARARVAITRTALRAHTTSAARCVGAARVGVRTCHLRARGSGSAQYSDCQKVTSLASSGLAVGRTAACENGVCSTIDNRRTVRACICRPIHQVVTIVAGGDLTVCRAGAREGGISRDVANYRTVRARIGCPVH
jgi:hypothetical protein